MSQDKSILYEKIIKAGCKFNKSEFFELIDGIAAAPEPTYQPYYLSLFIGNSTKLHQDLNILLLEYVNKIRYLNQAIENPKDNKPRLNSLRKHLARFGVSGFIIPHNDEYLGEYLSSRGERLAWLTGFTGSAGTAIVLQGKAALFIDGRYTIQAKNQVSEKYYEHVCNSEESYTNWVKKSLRTDDILGYDPRLHSIKAARKLRAMCISLGAELKALDSNPIDHIWTKQPPPPLAPISIHALKYAGKSSKDKYSNIVNSIKRLNADAVILTATDSIAWLLNIRGGDVPNCPLAHCVAIASINEKIKLFIDKRKISHSVKLRIIEIAELYEPNQLEPFLKEFSKENKSLLLDENGTPEWFYNLITKFGGKVVYGSDPCLRPKAIKNSIELEGTRSAHIRDGVALTKFLAWLDTNISRTSVDELSAAKKLSEFRSANPAYRGPSFETISSFGPNGAIVHYQANIATNRTLEEGSLYLLDSGAQYFDGTTDVTRTIAIGIPSEEMCDSYTRVLKGHISIACARYPMGTRGDQLDILARQFLWNVGLDYNHGTGHGVGSFLNVHEGPQRISKSSSEIILEPGMIISNEPGYYKTNEFGIRIENLIAVTNIPKFSNGEKQFLAFETLTLAPIDTSLIKKELLTSREILWIDAYHARVADELKAFLEDDQLTMSWLLKATKAI